MSPLAGVIDPSNDAYADMIAGVPPKWLDPTELLGIAARSEPSWSAWPYEMLKSALDAQQSRDYVSCTLLVSACMRSAVIERREPFIGTLDNMYLALRGTQIHRTLEGTARPGSVAEGRFFYRIDVPKAGKVEVSCSPDLVTADGQLWDWKVVRDLPVFQHPYKSHTAQVNINRYLVNHAERWELPDDADIPWDPRQLVFRRLALGYLGPKGPKVLECTRAQDIVYKNGNAGRKQLPYIWSDEEVEEFMLPRLNGMVRALDAYPEWPTGLDEIPGFEGPASWACPGKPFCNLPDCLAKAWKPTLNALGRDGLMWESP